LLLLRPFDSASVTIFIDGLLCQSSLVAMTRPNLENNRSGEPLHLSESETIRFLAVRGSTEDENADACVLSWETLCLLLAQARTISN
jgi:hypothetical protein